MKIMSSSSNSGSGGFGLKSFAILLTVLFVGLKLTGNIAWSWFWVLSPVIFVYGFLILVVTLLLTLLAALNSQR